ncbi:MAG: LysR family transcriptional regulator, partial [Myxococcota bacterium]
MTDLDEIATFVRVVEAEGFSAAAQSLGVPKSTVSRRVARLEERLGVRLLHRTTRRMRPTPEGQGFFDHVAPAVSVLRRASVELSEGRDTPRGVLRITAPVDFGHTYLADVISTFVAKYPEVTVDLRLSGKIVDLVKDGFDVAIRAGRLADSSLVARRLGRTDFYLVASPKYLTDAPPIESPGDLKAHRCLVHTAAGREPAWTLTQADGSTLTVAPTPHVRSDEFSFLLRAACLGTGVARLPVFLSEEALSDGRLVRVLPEYQIGGGWLHLVYPTSRQLPAKTAAFRDHIIECLASTSWAGIEPR